MVCRVFKMNTLLTFVAVEVAGNVDAFASHHHHFVSFKSKKEQFSIQNPQKIISNCQHPVSDGSACKFFHGR